MRRTQMPLRLQADDRVAARPWGYSALGSDCRRQRFAQPQTIDMAQERVSISLLAQERSYSLV